jgi:hypothetical protein
MIHEVETGKLFFFEPDGNDGWNVEVSVPESLLSEEPFPWFEMDVGGILYRGQARGKPQMDDDGRVWYSLNMQAESE